MYRTASPNYISLPGKEGPGQPANYTSAMQGVSVVVTVLNEVEDLGMLVGSLLEQQLAATEVIVVDGGSSDGTWEWLVEAAKSHASLRPIRDESCNLRQCAGPISRGRNVAIAAAGTEIIACADAGCLYAPDWLERLTAPLRQGTAEYALGGSCLAAEGATVWDLASAPFFGVKLDAAEPTKSCTARSMAFRKELWQRLGGFSETVFFGEDTLFDREARSLTRPVFVDRAKAFYRPQYGFRSAVRQLADYAVSDGIAGVRPVRLFRNAARCMAEIFAAVVFVWAVIPLLVVFALEMYFAFRLDGRSLLRAAGRSWRLPQMLAARMMFSLLVPWIVAANQVLGAWRKTPRPNRQNR